MKKIGQIKAAASLLLLLITVTGALAQDSLEKVWISAGQMPEFPGGQAEMMKYISTHVDYPDEAANQGITGRVMVRFVVNTDGSLSEIGVARPVHPLLDSASIKMVREMPKWTPGQQDDQKVRVQVVIPVHFSLQTVPPDKDSIYSIVQKMPSFPGGTVALDKYIDTALKYPNTARVNKIQGTVLVECVIGKEGNIETAKIAKGIGWRCDEEALRIVQEMPYWNPGTVKGVPVKVRYTLEITFVIKELYVTDGTRYVEGEGSLFSWKGTGNSLPTDTLNHPPYFPGGMDSMYYFIGNYLRFPEKAIKWGVQGKVLVRFVVLKDGTITEIAIENSEHDLLNDEAMRVVQIMPKWIPARENGKPVTATHFLPINFVLTR